MKHHSHTAWRVNTTGEIFQRLNRVKVGRNRINLGIFNSTTSSLSTPLYRCYSLYVKRTITLILFAGLVSGCGNSSELVTSPQKKVHALVGTNGQLIPIQSDNVLAAGYEINSMTMTVRFNNGYTYEYYGIAAEVWDSFLAAQPHPWSQVGYPQLVQAGVPYKRIS